MIELPVITSYDGVRYLRTGFCSRCGACCDGPEPCPQLSYDAAGLAVCAGYRTSPTSLAGCNVYPQGPRQIADKPCTYRFTVIEEFAGG